MRVVIAAVGKAKEPELRALLDDYYKRVRRYSECVEVELRDERDDKVALAFEKAVAGQGPRAELVTLEIAGDRLSSEGFARRLGDSLDRSSIPVFAIGGAEGLPAAVRGAARWRLSLGAMTLPHRLARLVLAEQLYRAFTILRGEPYNK